MKFKGGPHVLLQLVSVCANDGIEEEDGGRPCYLISPARGALSLSLSLAQVQSFILQRNTGSPRQLSSLLSLSFRFLILI